MTVDRFVASLVNTYGLSNIRFIADHTRKCEIQNLSLKNENLITSIGNELESIFSYLNDDERKKINETFIAHFSNAELVKNGSIDHEELDELFLAFSKDQMVFSTVKGAIQRELNKSYIEQFPEGVQPDWTTIDLGLGILLNYRLGNPVAIQSNPAIGKYLQDEAIVAVNDDGSSHAFAFRNRVPWFELHSGISTTDIGFELNGHGGNILCSKGLIFVGKNTIHEIQGIESKLKKIFPCSQIIPVGLSEIQNLEYWRNCPATVYQPLYHIDLFMAILNHDPKTRLTILLAEPRVVHYQGQLRTEECDLLNNLQKAMVDTEKNLIIDLEKCGYKGKTDILRCPMGVYMNQVTEVNSYRITGHYPLINGIFETHGFGRSLVTALSSSRRPIPKCDVTALQFDFMKDLNSYGYPVSILDMKPDVLAGLHCKTLVFART